MKTAYSYRRWSTASQTDKDSNIRQSNSANLWMKEHGTALGYVLSKEIFTDAAKSSYKGKNIAVDEYGRAKGDLARFIQCVEDGKISNDSILLIDSYDRFSRLPTSKSLSLFMQVINSGIGLVFTGSYNKKIINTELIDREDGILYEIIGEIRRSFRESEEKGRKVREAKQTLFSDIKNGLIRCNNLPKYFTFVPDSPKSSYGKYIHNKHTETVAKIVKLFLAGKSLYSIAETLNELNTPTVKYAGKWNATTIRNILQNELLKGEYKGNANYVPPIIDSVEYDKIQNILKQNQFNRGRKSEFINIFRGVCQCTCGAAATIMTSYVSPTTKKRYETPYRYLRCSKFGKHSGCANKGSIRLYDMEKEFFLNFLFNTPQQLLNNNDNAELRALKESIVTRQAKLNKLTTQIKTLLALQDGLEDLEELKTQLAAHYKEREMVKAELDNLNLKVSNVEDAPDTLINLKSIFEKGRNVRSHEEALTNPEHVKNHRNLFVAIEQIIDGLHDNYIREGIRIMLPPLIGKIVIDAKNHQFYVHNRMGKIVYKSEKHVPLQNCTEAWKEGLRNYTTRKLKTGRIITLKRKLSQGN
jgi:hypothetical protein